MHLYNTAATARPNRSKINQKELKKIFLDITELTKYGQSLDMQTEKEEDFINTFTNERYESIVTFKTSYYTTYLPIISAVLLCYDVESSKSPELSPKNIKALTEILLNLGKLFQIQDDYLDVYGNAKITGKVRNCHITNILE